MNQVIIRNCNERVKEDDLLFFLGDLGFKSSTGRGEGEPEKLANYIAQINCKNVIYLNGNHDTKGRNSFKTPIQNIVIRHGGKFIKLLHNPKFADTNYPINLVGHVHTNWEIIRIKKGYSFTDCVNVGIDVWNFYPLTWREIEKRYSQWRTKNNYEKTN